MSILICGYIGYGIAYLFEKLSKLVYVVIGLLSFLCFISVFGWWIYFTDVFGEEPLPDIFDVILAFGAICGIIFGFITKLFPKIVSKALYSEKNTKEERDVDSKTEN